MKTMKRFGCLLLVLAMVLALGVTAMAAPQTLASSPGITGSITINNAVANEEYTIYQIFDLTYADDYSSYSYSIVDGWEGFLKETLPSGVYDAPDYTTWEDYIILLSNGYVDVDSPIFNEEAGSTVLVAMAKAMLAYAEENDAISGITVSADADGNVTVTPEGAVSATAGNFVLDSEGSGAYFGTISISGLNLGYWLVGTSLGSLCMLDNNDPDAFIEEKNSTPTLDKWVMDITVKDADDSEVKEDDADVVDTLRYEILIQDAANTTSLVLHDIMDEELILQHVDPEDETSDWDIELYLVDTTTNPVTYALITSGYTLTVPGSDGCNFDIAFDNSFTAGLSGTDDILVIYTVKIDAGEDAFEGGIQEWDNVAYLTYGLSQETPPAETETYSYGIEVFKYTPEDASAGMDHVITVNVYYDLNAGGDQYVLYYYVNNGTEDSDYYFAVFDTGNQDSTGWTNAEFTITKWTQDWSEATFIDEPDDLTDPGETSVTYTWTFYYSGVLPEDVDIMLGEVEANDGISALEPEHGADVVSAGVRTGLAGATFVLKYVSDETTYYATLEYESAQGFYLLTGWTTDSSDATKMTTPEDGMIVIEGLSHDTTYYLEEVSAPDGYNKLTEDIVVNIVLDDNTYGTFHVEYTYNGETSTGTVEVENLKGTILPGTGGIGTTIFYVIGAILVCGAVVLLVTKRRTSNKNQAEA